MCGNEMSGLLRKPLVVLGLFAVIVAGTFFGVSTEGAEPVTAALAQDNHAVPADDRFTPWAVPVPLLPDGVYDWSDVAAPPLVDSGGKAWVLVSAHRDDTTQLLVTAWDSKVNVWSAPEVVYSTQSLVYPPAVSIDAQDRITAAFRDLGSGMDLLNVLRYVPGAGWRGPVTIADRGDFFKRVQTAVDAEGNVLVTYKGENARSLWIAMYNAARDLWLPGARVEEQAFDFSLVQDETGGHIYLIYVGLDEQERPAFYSRRFLSLRDGWSERERIPRTGWATNGGGSEALPIVVDSLGDITLPYFRKHWLGGGNSFVHTLRAMRREAFVWGTPTILARHVGAENDTAGFTYTADVDRNNLGDLMYLDFLDVDDSVHLRAYHYRADLGRWSAPVSILTAPFESGQPVQVAFLADGRALATFPDSNIRAFNSRVFDGGSWGSGFFPIPGGPSGTKHYLASAGDDALMIYSDYTTAYVTWFDASKSLRALVNETSGSE